ncbi:efflux RND transporter permease subunit [Arenimonas fontis]|uniref:Efflux RND transporter permease subunit n=1 Tax=Arenimonas fontis TaxID=2608255 RepID=A0A5B2ZBG1_9GAMM|nr:efflux RND transporter permease subunit [Arenimonas fontis]KAA2286008.1 efflux RND transporter permease subunit [Arenimonas fontis]
MSPAELSLRRPVTAVMFYVSLVVIGLIAAFRLPLEMFPDVNVPFVMVDIPYPGSTPEEVERTITRPAEEALATLSGIRRMGSTSRPDGANIFIEFSDWDRDIEVTASEARDRLDAIRNELPDDLQRYHVLKFSPADQPVLRVRFAGDRDFRNEYALIDEQFKRRIERLSGVARVDISGAAPPEVEIAIDPDRLSAHGLGLNELAERLRSVNFSVSAGEIDEGRQRLRVQPVGELGSLDELRGLVLTREGLRLSDIAVVRLKGQSVDYGRRLDGRPAVGIDIFRERNANLVEVSREVMAELRRINAEPEFRDVQLNVIDDQADGVTGSIRELVEAGLVGSLLSLMVLFYFLRHWPSTLMVTLAIPICIVMTLGAMYFFGMSLNILSMMGMLIGIGMLVDNAVVVVESIYQYREKYPGNPVRCAIEGTRGVQVAISAGTLTSIIVFAPNLFGERNFLSIYLGQVAITITIALLASWLVAVSLIPMISARLRTPPAVTAEHGFVPALTRRYARLLRWSLDNRGKALLAMMLVVLVSIVPMTRTQMDFFRNEVGRRLEMYFDWKGAYSLEQISDEVLRVENFLHANRDKYQIKQVYSWFSERGWAGIQVTLRDPNPSLWDKLLLRKTEPGLLSSEEVQEMLRKDIPRTARADIGFQGGGNRDGGDEGIRVYLNGDSTETLQEIAENLIPMLSSRPELRDVRVDIGDENAEVQVSVDRERAAALGFSAQEVATYVGIALRGTPLREFRQGQSEVPVWVRFDGSEEFRMEDMAALTLRRSDGTSVPLLSVVDVQVRRGATQIRRENRQTSLVLQANLAKDVTLPDARKAIEAILQTANFPSGYRWSFGGSFQQDDDAGKQMVFNLLLAMVMVYLVMAALFESMLFPSAIISSIFFSALGVFWLFAFTGTTFTIMAFIGCLVLMGVVVNNGIVLFEHINGFRRAGMARTDALVHGCKERLRPILMTTCTTVLAMLPLCIAGTQLGGDGPAYYPMARAIAGGLVFSTLVSLLFLPTIYALMDDLRSWTGALLARARARALFARGAGSGG